MSNIQCSLDNNTNQLEFLVEVWEVYVSYGYYSAYLFDYTTNIELYVPELSMTLSTYNNRLNRRISLKHRYSEKDVNTKYGKLLKTINISGQKAKALQWLYDSIKLEVDHVSLFEELEKIKKD
jgi:hypothetical protein